VWVIHSVLKSRARKSFLESIQGIGNRRGKKGGEAVNKDRHG